MEPHQPRILTRSNRPRFVQRFDLVRGVPQFRKDLVRLLPFRPFPLPVGYVPLTMEPEPLPEFRRWLEASLRAARDSIVD